MNNTLLESPWVDIEHSEPARRAMGAIAAGGRESK